MRITRMCKIITNIAECLKCGDVIESKHRHDFVTCSCGNLSVDGGKDYLKRSVKEQDQYRDMSIFDSEKDSDT